MADCDPETVNLAELLDDDYNGIENAAYGIVHKTNSLPVNATMGAWTDDDLIIRSANAVPAEDLAAQLSLLDMPVFASIRAVELSTCAWNKKNKATMAPNVVAFTRRFNQVTFWTVQEVLNGTTAKRRAEIITHFIKVAKRLYELNNLHSLFAVISGLQSVSIYRLTQSWSCLSKKDRHSFDRMAQLFNEDNNWSTLREYLNNLKPPCIPYLGIFLTDLVYLDVAHDSANRSSKMKAIIESLAFYQKSDYTIVKPDLVVQEYLMSVRYIEELQKFHEDDQYKLSLKLEPPSAGSSACSSKESVKVGEPGPTVSNATRNSTGRNSTGRNSTGLSLQSKFHLGHRKTQSLGTNMYNGTSENGNERTSIGRVNLLDDTVLENPELAINESSSCKLRSLSDLSSGPLPANLDNTFQSSIKRKTILKDGRKPPVSSYWQRYWLQMWTNSLIYYSPKAFKGVFKATRSNYKQEPCKIQNLENWTTSMKDASDSFVLMNSKIGSVYKFRAETHEIAAHWFALIQSEILKSQKPLPANLMSFE